ncbi:hypothetical protein E2C01_054770 [Portunus trituberculatus]|uniref:Uncharacterized protein n=1 Tax=Portunus trituberculatus TaxID=210409 RepID=A0A5B7GVW9_PORTR|nr:hypothetical protein [Portunus trituberculatus]
MVLDSARALIFPSPERVNWFLSMAQSFLEDRIPTVFLWRSLLVGVLFWGTLISRLWSPQEQRFTSTTLRLWLFFGLHSHFSRNCRARWCLSWQTIRQ